MAEMGGFNLKISLFFFWIMTGGCKVWLILVWGLVVVLFWLGFGFEHEGRQFGWHKEVLVHGLALLELIHTNRSLV